VVRLAVLGVGAIGRAILDGVAAGQAGNVTLVAVADVAAKAADLEREARRSGAAITHEPAELPAYAPDLIVEAASQHAVRAYAAGWLSRGVDVAPLSVGALADGDVLRELDKAARAAGRRIHIPSGALGGCDALRAARVGGLDSVRLRTSKPPAALAGAPFFAEHGIDVAQIDRAITIYEGCAADAVQRFPANVNVAATVSLAGIGPDRTCVEIVADPELDHNLHEIIAEGAFGRMHLTFRNAPSPTNPRTSLLACLSPLALIERLGSTLQIG